MKKKTKNVNNIAEFIKSTDLDVDVNTYILIIKVERLIFGLEYINVFSNKLKYLN